MRRRAAEVIQVTISSWVLLCSGLCTLVRADDASSVDLTAGRGLAASRVHVQFDVGGDLTLEGRDGKAKVPMSVVAELSYREQPQTSVEAAAQPTAGDVTSLRFYDLAHATIKIDKGGVNLELPDEMRLIAATAGPNSAILASPAGPLAREQLELIDVPAGSHVLDRLLPGRPLKTGETFEHDKESMRLLLGLDEVHVCEVESVLFGIEQGYAKLRLAGTVFGKTDAAATELQVQAGYLFDTRTRRISRLNLVFSEKREAGRVGPAVDVVGKLNVEVDSLAEVERIAADELAKVANGAADFETRLQVDDTEAGLRFLHDRDWHVTSEGSDRVVLRRIDGGEFIAQCIIHVRPERQEGRQSTIAEFERDVRFSLGERFESLVSTGEWTNAAGLLCYRMVVHGNVDGLPVEWRYFLAAPTEGRSVAIAVSVEPRFTEQLGDADKAIVESIELLPGLEATPSESSESVQKPAESAIR